MKTIALLKLVNYDSIHVEQHPLFTDNTNTVPKPYQVFYYKFDGKKITKITHKKFEKLLPNNNVYFCGESIKLFHAFVDYDENKDNFQYFICIKEKSSSLFKLNELVNSCHNLSFASDTEHWKRATLEEIFNNWKNYKYK